MGVIAQPTDGESYPHGDRTAHSLLPDSGEHTSKSPSPWAPQPPQKSQLIPVTENARISWCESKREKDTFPKRDRLHLINHPHDLQGKARRNVKEVPLTGGNGGFGFQEPEKLSLVTKQEKPSTVSVKHKVGSTSSRSNGLVVEHSSLCLQNTSSFLEMCFRGQQNRIPSEIRLLHPELSLVGATEGERNTGRCGGAQEAI